MIVGDEEEPAQAVKAYCDACCRTTADGGQELQLAVLQATWRLGAIHEGERYHIRLCEECFFRVLGDLRFQRAIQEPFDEPAEILRTFGRVIDKRGEGELEKDE
ncbi:hypothetical protein [Pseudomonas knackmussii]|uniref:hypothetical protein n=1 Tax=Pseudomonas knackmussii TaxID=65741 RepID=UPI0012EBCAF7|nr:hypothetical protein [Pseudomonas knackmussii]